jgi:hypothetical protein
MKMGPPSKLDKSVAQNVRISEYSLLRISVDQNIRGPEYP